MKKVLLLLMVAVMLFSSLTVSAASVVTMYAPDGRTINVYDYEVSSYKSVGWYDYPVTTVYAPGGRHMVIASWETQAYTNAGWYTYPVVHVFDDDLNPYLINLGEAEYYINRGYNLPTYCADGVTIYGGSGYYYYHKNNWGSITSIDSFSISYTVVNTSGKTICVRPDTVKINGVSFNGVMSENIPAGTSKAVQITVNGPSIYSHGIRNISKVESSVRFFDWDYTIGGTSEISVFGN